MIVRERPTWFQLMFAMRGSVLPQILPRVIGLCVFSAVTVWVDRFVLDLPHTDVAPFAVFGIALSLFLGFRNNAAYERWWEGRQLWGQLIASVRSLARDCEAFVPDQDTRCKVLRLSLAFLHLHRAQLRGVNDDTSAAAWSDVDLSNDANPACAALNEISRGLATQPLDGFAKRALYERLAEMALAQAGNERIATTPLPFVYSLLVFRTTYLYCLLLPFGLMESAMWMTPLFVGVVAYMFFGLAEVTEELSNPFGKTVNGLALDAICRTAERSIAPYLGETIPEPLAPEKNYLG